MQVLNTTQLIVEVLDNKGVVEEQLWPKLVTLVPSLECVDKGVKWLLAMKLIYRMVPSGLLKRTMPRPVATLVGPSELKFHLLDIICCAMQAVAVADLELMVRQQGIAVYGTQPMPSMRGDATPVLVTTQVHVVLNKLAEDGLIAPRSVLLEYQPTFDFDGLPSGHMIAMQPGTEYFATLDGYRYRAEGLGNE